MTKFGTTTLVGSFRLFESLDELEELDELDELDRFGTSAIFFLSGVGILRVSLLPTVLRCSSSELEFDRKFPVSHFVAFVKILSSFGFLLVGGFRPSLGPFIGTL